MREEAAAVVMREAAAAVLKRTTLFRTSIPRIQWWCGPPCRPHAGSLTPARAAALLGRPCTMSDGPRTSLGGFGMGGMREKLEEAKKLASAKAKEVAEAASASLEANPQAWSLADKAAPYGHRSACSYAVRVERCTWSFRAAPGGRQISLYALRVERST